jgi:hypothetical protein
MSSRSVIDQVLRKVSQQRNTKLRQVASELVTAIARAGDGDR